jgi:hypothetical protein
VSNPIEELIEQMPEPSSFADQIHAPSSGDVENPVENGSDTPVETVESPSPLEWAEPTSTAGDDEVFNPDIHCVDENGNPRRTKSGKFRRKPGRKNASNYAQMSPEQMNEAKMMNAKAAAQVSVAATFITGQLIFGTEGAPIIDPANGIDEPQQMEAAYTQFYYLSKNPVNVPPWMLIAVVAGAYTARRMAMDKPRNRVMKGINWIKMQVFKAYVFIVGG